MQMWQKPSSIFVIIRGLSNLRCRVKDPCGFIGHEALGCESSDTFSTMTQHQPFSEQYNGFLADHKSPW